MDPSKRFVTAILAAGIVVLLAAIALGERMGDRVFGQGTERQLASVATVTITPDPNQVSGPYGPDWKASQTLAAAPDPRFPDPRIPPQPLPTPAEAPTPHAAHAAPWTPNPNIPIWDQTQPPSPTPSPQASSSPASGTAAPTAPLSPSSSPASPAAKHARRAASLAPEPIATPSP